VKYSRKPLYKEKDPLEDIIGEPEVESRFQNVWNLSHEDYHKEMERIEL